MKPWIEIFTFVRVCVGKLTLLTVWEGVKFPPLFLIPLSPLYTIFTPLLIEHFLHVLSSLTYSKSYQINFCSASVFVQGPDPHFHLKNYTASLKQIQFF